MGWQVRPHFWRVRNHISTLSFKHIRFIVELLLSTLVWPIYEFEIQKFQRKIWVRFQVLWRIFFYVPCPVILDSGYDCCWYINGRSCHAASDHEASNGGCSSCCCSGRGSSSGTSPGSKARRWEDGPIVDVPRGKTNMTNWKIPLVNRKYIFIHGGFSSQSC